MNYRVKYNKPITFTLRKPVNTYTLKVKKEGYKSVEIQRGFKKGCIKRTCSLYLIFTTLC